LHDDCTVSENVLLGSSDIVPSASVRIESILSTSGSLSRHCDGSVWRVS